jgi:multiple sugar transport system substrate-binding protein
MKPISKKITFKLIASLIGLALLSVGCGGTPAVTNKPATLKIWKPFVDSQQMQPLLSAYQLAHPNVQIVYTEKNTENYEADLIDALASGNGPDIFSINNNWLPKYLDKIVPAPSKTFTLKDYKDAFVDTVVQDFAVGNDIYGTALWVDSLALYYNKDLLGTVGIATPPKTWAELAADSQKLTRKDQSGYFTRSGIAMGLSSNVNRGVDILYLLMLQAGSTPWSPDHLNPTFNGNVQKNGNFINPGVDALRFYTSFANPNDQNYTWNARSDYSIDAFANGRTAFLVNYYYSYPTIIQKAPNLNFDVAPIPQLNLDDPSINYANYWGEVVSKQSKNSAVAWDFLHFITQKKNLEAYYKQDKEPSSRKDIIDSQINDTQIGTFAHANLTAKSFYKPDQVKMDNIFGQMIDNVVLKGVRVEDAVGQAQVQAGTLTRH